MPEYIDRSVYSSDYPFLENLDNKCYYPNTWAETDFRRHNLILLRAAAPVGYIAYRPMIGRTLHIMRFGVHPAFRRQGKGKHFLDFAINYTLCDHFTFIIPESNAEGLAFLRNCGHPIRHTNLINGNWYYFKLEANRESGSN